jgi:hypothetical protein
MSATTVAGGGPAAGSALPAIRPALASLAALAFSALLVTAAMGAYSPDLRATARLVLVTSVIAVLAPLFWPGRAPTELATIWRVLGWSLGATLLAAVAGLVLGGTPQLGTACLTLLLICISTHGAAAWAESLLARRGAHAGVARSTAAWLATALLGLAGAAPLWLGPAAELAATKRPQALAAVVAVSPLTHLAVTSGNDLLRNQWFYQHSNLSGLRFDYPRLMPILAGYAALSLVLIGVPAVARSPHGPGLKPTSSKEQVP